MKRCCPWCGHENNGPLVLCTELHDDQQMTCEEFAIMKRRYYGLPIRQVPPLLIKTGEPDD